MSDEYWATFSIYDHRLASLYRKTLVLFDRVVIPVPTEPVGDLQQQEIKALAADVSYLEDNDAAVQFTWDRNEFFEWQKKTVNSEGVDGEALAATLTKDPPFATRLQLSQTYNAIAPQLLPAGVDSVIAVPSYGSRERYEAVTNDLRGHVAERTVLEIILNNISVPDADVPLEDIIRLRQDAQFRDSMYQLRNWQMQTVGELLDHSDDRLVRAAENDFQRWIKQYDEAMTDAQIKKAQTAIVSVLAVGATLAVGAGPLVGFLAAIAPPLFSIQELVQPCWKQIADKQFAPAGVVYAVSRL